MRKIGIGVIGCDAEWNAGRIGLPEGLSDDCELVAFCDPVPERVQRACMEYGAPGAKAYLDYRELLANPKVEVLSLHTRDIPLEALSAAATDTNRSISASPPNRQKLLALHEAWSKGGNDGIYYVI